MYKMIKVYSRTTKQGKSCISGFYHPSQVNYHAKTKLVTSMITSALTSYKPSLDFSECQKQLSAALARVELN